MDKYEILAKSLEDNGVSDERERIVGYKAGYIAFLSITVAWLIFWIFNFITGQPNYQIAALWFIGLTAASIYSYTKTRNRGHLLLIIFTALGSIVFMVLYVLQVFGI